VRESRKPTGIRCRGPSAKDALLLIGHPSYEVSVTLLVYTTTAHGKEPDGAAFARICQAMDERYPLAFSIIATRGSTESTRANARRDWVTLPDSSDLWPHSEETAARMLVAYARQYRARATLFVGSDASRINDACRRVATTDHDLGEQLIVSSEGTPLGPLFETLDKVLPASFLISDKSNSATIATDLERHPSKAGIALYWQGAPSHHALEILQLAKDHTGGKVSVQFGLRDIALNIAKGLPALWRLATLNEPRVTVSIVAEDGIACSTGRAMTRLLDKLHRRRA